MLLAFIAGMLSTLSPCVLPLLPIVLATAVSEHRLAPLALGAGLALSFTGIGFFIATIGFSLGIDFDLVRMVAATLLILMGVVLMVPRLQLAAATASGPLSNWTEQRFGGFAPTGLSGQFGAGVLLGAIWTPCVGPTLGAASLLAARGENLGYVALTMFIFGIGTAIPLLFFGLISRDAMTRWRGRILHGSSAAKVVLGTILVVAGGLTLFGLDRALATAIEGVLPLWLVELTTRF